MDLLDETIKEGKFVKEGDILDLLILLYKSLGTAQLSNEKHKRILKNLGDVLAEGHPKTAYYRNTLTLLGSAIKHGKLLENKHHQETLRFVGKLVETNKFSPEEAVEILTVMLVHNLRLGHHHYERLGLQAVKPEEEFLKKIESQSYHKIKTSKKKKKCKKCEKRKRNKNKKSVKRRRKRTASPKFPFSKSKAELSISRSPDTNSNVIMMSDDQNAYIEYNNPEDTIIQPIIKNQKAIDSLNNTRPPTSNVNFNVANINKVHIENSSHDDFNSEHGNHIPKQILTKDNSGNVRTVPVAGSKFQNVSSKDINVKPQIKSNIPHVIRSHNRIILTFNVGRSRE